MKTPTDASAATFPPSVRILVSLAVGFVMMTSGVVAFVLHADSPRSAACIPEWVGLPALPLAMILDDTNPTVIITGTLVLSALIWAWIADSFLRRVLA